MTPQRAPAPIEIEPAALPQRNLVRLATGLALGVTSWTEPVTHVRSQRRVGVRFVRDLATADDRLLTALERDRLEPLEKAELDVAALAEARDTLAREQRAGGLALLPISFPSFANRPARTRLTAALAGMSDEERSALVLEIEDLAPGTPPGRIVESVGLIRGYARAVMVRSPTNRAAVEALRGARVQGLVLDAAALDGRAGEVFGRLRLLRERAQGVSREVMALGLPTPALIPVIVAAGATFYSVRPSAEPLAQAV